MPTLLLIRHGRTSANANGVLAGRSPGVVLDEHGITTVTELGKRLQALPLVQVVSSPLERTRQTTDLAFLGRVPVAHEDQLLECDYGDWQGRELGELAKEELWKEVQSKPDQVEFPNGETMTNMQDRSVRAIRAWDKRIEETHGSQAIWAAVSHGDVIKAICADALGLPLRAFQSIMIEPASVSVIHYGEHGSSVRKLNDTGEAWLETLATQKNGPATVGGESGKQEKS
jgi:2,3-bisphosphoglycerate-dependent phosphoglycerate mutase